VKPFPLIAAVLLAAAVATPLEAQTLRGSRASVDRIYGQARSHSLHFHENSTSVRRAVQQGTLVRLNGNANYKVEGATYPYLLPEAHTFVLRLAAQYRSACGEKLVVTSAVRPRTLRLANSSDRSVHPTGMAVDLRKPGKAKCLTWLRNTLLALEGQNVIEAVEEFRPPHFHVAVFPRQYKTYVQRQGGAVPGASAFVGSSGSGTTRPRPAAAPNASTRTVTYQVRRGDTLWTIARRHGTSVEELKAANQLRNPDIRAGQRLVIPSNSR
jgi:hypothetical protein